MQTAVLPRELATHAVSATHAVAAHAVSATHAVAAHAVSEGTKAVGASSRGLVQRRVLHHAPRFYFEGQAKPG
jgi:hypothetical protein